MARPLCGWHRRAGTTSTRGGRKKGGGDLALGRSRGGWGTKVPLRVEGSGKPVVWVLTPGQQHEATVFEELMTRGAVKRPGMGRPRLRPERVCGNKGTAAGRSGRVCAGAASAAPSPAKRTNGAKGPLTAPCTGHATGVERAIHRLKPFRRIATRYEKQTENYLAMLHIGSILLWL